MARHCANCGLRQVGSDKHCWNCGANVRTGAKPGATPVKDTVFKQNSARRVLIYAFFAVMSVLVLRECFRSSEVVTVEMKDTPTVVTADTPSLERAPTPAQVPCGPFEDGYRDVQWHSNANRIDRFFKDKVFKSEVFEDFRTNDNRQGLVVLYSRGSYADFRSDRDHEEVNLVFLDDHPISIKYIFHFNWTYHIDTAKEIAIDIASKHKLPMTANQVGRFGNINLAWVGSCNNKRIIAQLVWTEVFEGEATRYVSFEVKKISENEEFKQLRISAARDDEEERKKKIKNRF